MSDNQVLLNAAHESSYFARKAVEKAVADLRKALAESGPEQVRTCMCELACARGFFGYSLPPEELTMLAAQHIPELNQEAEC